MDVYGEFMTKKDYWEIGTKIYREDGSFYLYLGKDVNNTKKGKFACSRCNSDTELFPDLFTKTRHDVFTRNNLGCLCDSKTKNCLDERQLHLLVTREAESKGLIFKGWAEPYRKMKTRITLYNPLYDTTWSSVFISRFLNDYQGNANNMCLGSTGLEDKVFIQKFKDVGGFSEDYSFKRSERLTSKKGYRTHWEVECPRCKNDEYVETGICTGVFEEATNRLVRGLLNCRCSKSYQWSEEERLYQINKMFINHPDCTFLGWDGEFMRSKSLVKWICKEGHDCSTLLTNFQRNPCRCNTCRENTRGYMEKLKGEKDTLYVVKVCSRSTSEVFCKVGRSLCFYGRNGRLENLNVNQKVTPIKTFTGTHEKVFKLEQHLHHIFPSVFGSFTPSYYFAGLTECYRIEDVEGILEYIKEVKENYDIQ